MTLSTKDAKAFPRHHRSLSDQFKFLPLLLLLLLTIAIFFSLLLLRVNTTRTVRKLFLCVCNCAVTQYFGGEHWIYRDGLPCQSPRATQTLSEIA